MRIRDSIVISMKLALLLVLVPIIGLAQDKPNEPASQPVGQSASQPSAEPKKDEAPKPANVITNPQTQDVTISAGDLAKAGAVAGAVGGILAAIIGAMVAYWNRSHEDRKQIREIAVQLALEEWRREEAVKDLRSQHRIVKGLQPGGVTADPIQPFVDKMFGFVEGLESRNTARITSENRAALKRGFATIRGWFKRKK